MSTLALKHVHLLPAAFF